MKKHLLAALSVGSLVMLSGCWNGCCDRKQTETAPVETSVAVAESTTVTETSVADAVETAVAEAPAAEETKL